MNYHRFISQEMVENDQKWLKIIKKLIFKVKNLIQYLKYNGYLNGNHLIRYGTQKFSKEFKSYRAVIFLIFSVTCNGHLRVIFFKKNLKKFSKIFLTTYDIGIHMHM